MNRRSFLGSSALATALAALPMCWVSPAMAEALKLSFGVGLGTEGAALVNTMQRGKLLEQAAKELGLEIEPEYLNFTVLLRMLQGIAAGQLQFGMLGSTPTIRMLAAPNPAIPIALAGGGVNFPLQVPKNSPIRNLDDLRGKTVLTLIGSDLHLVLLLMLKAHFDTDDVAKLGITVKNVQAITELTRAQSGIDAVLSVEPHGQGAQNAGELVTLLRNDGSTGPAWDGPEGKGEGHKVASFAKTPFAPEAFYPHRIWWAVREDFLARHPDAVTALLAANARAAEMVSAMTTDEVIDLASAQWFGDRAAQKPFVERILWRRRGWAWATEGDARSLVGLSKVKTIYEHELSGEQVKGLMAKAAPAVRKAWELVGRKPDAAAFADTSAGDIRGRPQWEAESWSL